MIRNYYRSNCRCKTTNNSVGRSVVVGNYTTLEMMSGESVGLSDAIGLYGVGVDFKFKQNGNDEWQPSSFIVAYPNKRFFTAAPFGTSAIGDNSVFKKFSGAIKVYSNDILVTELTNELRFEGDVIGCPSGNTVSRIKIPNPIKDYQPTGEFSDNTLGNGSFSSPSIEE